LGLASTVRASGEGVRRTAVVDAVRRAGPAVVVVQTEGPGRSANSVIRGSGSGVIVHPDGLVITNSHVIRGAQRIVIETPKASGVASRRLEATLVEDDPSHDLALLRVARGAGLPHVGLRTTSEVMVGESAIAIGSPYGLGPSVTMGVVSAVGRSAAVPSGIVLRNLLQTDASINFGNSGGALLDLEGDLLGINCSVHPQGQGIAFTIPADQVRALLERNAPSRPKAASPADAPVLPVARAPAPMLSGPPPSARGDAPSRTLPPAARPSPPPAVPAPSAGRPSLGMSLRSADGGVAVGAVEAHSPAEIAGLLSGDVIVEIDGRAASSASDVAGQFRSAPRGRAFLLTLQRGDRRTRVVLVVPSV
jgi:S1-C subfamily serine protease